MYFIVIIIIMDVRYNVATCNGAKNFYKKKMQGNSANHFTNVHTYLLILFGVVNYNVFKKPRLNTFIWAKCTIVHIICLSSGSRLWPGVGIFPLGTLYVGAHSSLVRKI